MFERYLASLDGTLKELRPCLAMVNRTLERHEERLAPVVQPKPFVAGGPYTQPRVVPTPVTAIKQGTIIKYLVKKSDDGTITRGTHRESRAQPTPPGEALASDGPETQPRDVSTPHGHGPERFDWRVDQRDNTYKYEKLLEPEGPAEHTRGKDPDMPFSTPVTQDLQHIRLLTRWSDKLLGSRWGLDKGSSALREDTRFQGQADSPVSHNNFWDRAVVQPSCDTSSSVYDGGGEHVPETPLDVDRATAKKYYVVQPTRVTSSSVYDGGGERVLETPPDVDGEEPKKYYVIHVDKLKLCTAATQSPDSVATQPTTH